MLMHMKTDISIGHLITQNNNSMCVCVIYSENNKQMPAKFDIYIQVRRE